MSERTEWKLTEAQGLVVEILVALIGMSGVHRKPEQGENIVLDLLPASHVVFSGQPFCVKVSPDGAMERITDAEAGITERPDPLEAMRASVDEMARRMEERHGSDGTA